MRRIRHLLTMHFGAGATSRAIALELGIAPSTVREYLGRGRCRNRLAACRRHERRKPDGAAVRQCRGPGWRAVSCRARLVGPGRRAQASRRQPAGAVGGLRRRAHQRATHPEGYAYSRFCQLFREFEQRLSPTMRQQHVAGHKAFVDYSGKQVPIINRATGEVRMAEIFVAVLGASSLTYAEATWTQTLPDWIGAHVRMFRFFGAAPRLLVPDNLKSAIHKASFVTAASWPPVIRVDGRLA